MHIIISMHNVHNIVFKNSLIFSHHLFVHILARESLFIVSLLRPISDVWGRGTHMTVIRSANEIINFGMVSSTERLG